MSFLEDQNQRDTASFLAIDLFDVIEKYDGQLLTSTVVGILEMLKAELIENHFAQTKQEMRK